VLRGSHFTAVRRAAALILGVAVKSQFVLPAL
jgi:hypothetical protein